MLENKLIYTLDQSERERLETQRESALPIALDFGLDVINDMLGLPIGYPIIIGARPAVGKTEFSLELILQSAELHGKKWVLLSGEIGRRELIWSELCHKYGRKPFNKTDSRGNEYPESQNELERAQSMDFVNAHFAIVDSSELPNIFEFEHLIKAIAERVDLKEYNNIFIDPAYEISLDSKIPMIDAKVGKLIGDLYKYNQKTNSTSIITNHIKRMDKNKKLDNGSAVHSPPAADEMSNGIMWERKGYTILMLHRFAEGELDEDGLSIPRNLLRCQIAKVKPKGTAREGFFDIKYNVGSGRYYETNAQGVDVYSRDLKAPEPVAAFNSSALIDAQSSFFDPDPDDAPF